MLRDISLGEVDLPGTALAVHYHADPEDRDLVVVSVTAHRTIGDGAYVHMSELRCLVVREPMSCADMEVRVQDEAAQYGISRVAWIEEH